MVIGKVGLHAESPGCAISSDGEAEMFISGIEEGSALMRPGHIFRGRPRPLRGVMMRHVPKAEDGVGSLSVVEVYRPPSYSHKTANRAQF